MKVELLQDLGVSQFPPPSNRRETTSSIVEVSLQIFRATRWSTNSHQTFTRHQSIILPCDDTKTAPTNSQTFRAATKHYIVRYKERLLRKLALSCSISSTKVLLCLENFIPLATLHSHSCKYRNEQVGGSLRQQWTRVPRVRESLRATSFVRRIYERRDEGCKHPRSLARVSSAGRRSRKIRTEDAITNFPRFYWFSILLLCFVLSPPPRKLSRFSLVGGRIRLLLLAGWVSIWLTYCRVSKEESSFHSLSCSFARENNRCRFSTTRS